MRDRAEALLESMLALMNQLADSARILNSPLAASLLTVPLNDEDQETNAAWSNAENLVKSLKVAAFPFQYAFHLNSCSTCSTAWIIKVLVRALISSLDGLRHAMHDSCSQPER